MKTSSPVNKIIKDPINYSVPHSGISVFPNPFHTEFILDVPSANDKTPVNILVFDLSGRLVNSFQRIIHDKTIKMGGDLKKGVYIVMISHGLEVQRVVLVKQ